MSRNEWKVIFLVLKDFSQKYKKVIASVVLLSALQGIRPYIAVVLTGMLLDAVYEGKDFVTLLRYALAGVGFACAVAVMDGILTGIFNKHLEYMVEIQNMPMNKKSMEMDYEYLEDAKVHDMRQRVNGAYRRFGLVGVILCDLNKLFTTAVSLIASIVIVLPMFFGGSAAEHGFIASWQLSALFFMILAVLIIINFRAGVYFNRKRADITNKNVQWENRKNFYLDLLARSESQKDLRIYQQQKLYEREMKQISGEGKAFGGKLAGCLIGNGVTGWTVAALMMLLVYVFAGLKAYAGIITIGGVVTYAASILKFAEAAGNLALYLSYFKEVSVYAGYYTEYMQLGQKKYEGTIPLEKRRDNKFSVEFEHVSFKYPGSDKYVIKDLNLSFVIGEKMAIVGKNGSGKTTFIKLLCRLYDVTEGCIKVNGIDIRKYDYQEYCALFAVVFQDFRMFAFPLGENIAASNQVDEKRAEDALVRAGLGERLQILMDGLNTYVGRDYDERGVNFSGGEKQKMAIARAIYKDAPFVIMDEPTAALDPESECEVFAGFDRMVGKKTAIYISHRLASCRFCEDILVFDKGQVVQRGSHEELEKQDGLYRELWNAQAQYYA